MCDCGSQFKDQFYQSILIGGGAGSNVIDSTHRTIEALNMASTEALHNVATSLNISYENLIKTISNINKNASKVTDETLNQLADMLVGAHENAFGVKLQGGSSLLKYMELIGGLNKMTQFSDAQLSELDTLSKEIALITEALYNYANTSDEKLNKKHLMEHFVRINDRISAVRKGLGSESKEMAELKKLLSGDKMNQIMMTLQSTDKLDNKSKKFILDTMSSLDKFNAHFVKANTAIQKIGLSADQFNAMNKDELRKFLKYYVDNGNGIKLDRLSLANYVDELKVSGDVLPRDMPKIVPDKASTDSKGKLQKGTLMELERTLELESKINYDGRLLRSEKNIARKEVAECLREMLVSAKISSKDLHKMDKLNSKVVDDFLMAMINLRTVDIDTLYENQSRNRSQYGWEYQFRSILAPIEYMIEKAEALRSSIPSISRFIDACKKYIKMLKKQEDTIKESIQQYKSRYDLGILFGGIDKFHDDNERATFKEVINAFLQGVVIGQVRKGMNLGLKDLETFDKSQDDIIGTVVGAEIGKMSAKFKKYSEKYKPLKNFPVGKKLFNKIIQDNFNGFSALKRAAQGLDEMVRTHHMHLIKNPDHANQIVDLLKHVSVDFNWMDNNQYDIIEFTKYFHMEAISENTKFEYKEGAAGGNVVPNNAFGMVGFDGAAADSGVTVAQASALRTRLAGTNAYLSTLSDTNTSIFTPFPVGLNQASAASVPTLILAMTTARKASFNVDKIDDFYREYQGTKSRVVNAYDGKKTFPSHTSDEATDVGWNGNVVAGRVPPGFMNAGGAAEDIVFLNEEDSLEMYDMALEKLKDASDKIGAIKNLFSIFQSIDDAYNKDAGQPRRKDGMTVAEIYELIIEYLVYTTMYPVMHITKENDTEGKYTCSHIALRHFGKDIVCPMAKTASKYNFSDYLRLVQASGTSIHGEKNPANPTDHQVRDGHTFLTYDDKLALANNEWNKGDSYYSRIDAKNFMFDYNFYYHDRMTVMMFKSAFTKVMGALSLYNLVNMKLTNNLGVNKIRSIYGGNDFSIGNFQKTPEIIAENIEVYSRIYIYGKFYKRLFFTGFNEGFNEGAAGDGRMNKFVNQAFAKQRMALLPVVGNNDFDDLFRILFVKDFGNLSQNIEQNLTANEYILAVNNLVKKKSRKDLVEQFVQEINRRYGIVSSSLIMKYMEKHEREAYDIQNEFIDPKNSLQVTEYEDAYHPLELLNGEGKVHNSVVPTDKVQYRRGFFSGIKSDQYQFEFDQVIATVYNFRVKLDKATETLSTRMNNTSNGAESLRTIYAASTLQDRIQSTVDAVNSRRQNSDKFSAVKKLLHNLERSDYDSIADSVVIYRELVLAPTAVLLKVYTRILANINIYGDPTNAVPLNKNLQIYNLRSILTDLVQMHEVADGNIKLDFENLRRTCGALLQNITKNHAVLKLRLDISAVPQRTQINRLDNMISSLIAFHGTMWANGEDFNIDYANIKFNPMVDYSEFPHILEVGENDQLDQIEKLVGTTINTVISMYPNLFNTLKRGGRDTATKIGNEIRSIISKLATSNGVAGADLNKVTLAVYRYFADQIKTMNNNYNSNVARTLYGGALETLKMTDMYVKMLQAWSIVNDSQSQLTGNNDTYRVRKELLKLDFITSVLRLNTPRRDAPDAADLVYNNSHTALIVGAANNEELRRISLGYGLRPGANHTAYLRAVDPAHLLNIEWVAKGDIGPLKALTDLEKMENANIINVINRTLTYDSILGGADIGNIMINYAARQHTILVMRLRTNMSTTIPAAAYVANETTYPVDMNRQLNKDVVNALNEFTLYMLGLMDVSQPVGAANAVLLARGDDYVGAAIVVHTLQEIYDKLRAPIMLAPGALDFIYDDSVYEIVAGLKSYTDADKNRRSTMVAMPDLASYGVNPSKIMYPEETMRIIKEMIPLRRRYEAIDKRNQNQLTNWVNAQRDDIRRIAMIGFKANMSIGYQKVVKVIQTNSPAFYNKMIKYIDTEDHGAGTVSDGTRLVDNYGYGIEPAATRADYVDYITNPYALANNDFVMNVRNATIDVNKYKIDLQAYESGTIEAYNNTAPANKARNIRELIPKITQYYIDTIGKLAVDAGAPDTSMDNAKADLGDYINAARNLDSNYIAIFADDIADPFPGAGGAIDAGTADILVVTKLFDALHKLDNDFRDKEKIASVNITDSANIEQFSEATIIDIKNAIYHTLKRYYHKNTALYYNSHADIVADMLLYVGYMKKVNEGANGPVVSAQATVVDDYKFKKEDILNADGDQKIEVGGKYPDNNDADTDFYTIMSGGGITINGPLLFALGNEYDEIKKRTVISHDLTKHIVQNIPVHSNRLIFSADYLNMTRNNDGPSRFTITNPIYENTKLVMSKIITQSYAYIDFLNKAALQANMRTVLSLLTHFRTLNADDRCMVIVRSGADVFDPKGTTIDDPTFQRARAVRQYIGNATSTALNATATAAAADNNMSKDLQILSYLAILYLELGNNRGEESLLKIYNAMHDLNPLIVADTPKSKIAIDKMLAYLNGCIARVKPLEFASLLGDIYIGGGEYIGKVGFVLSDKGDGTSEIEQIADLTAAPIVDGVKVFIGDTKQDYDASKARIVKYSMKSSEKTFAEHADIIKQAVADLLLYDDMSPEYVTFNETLVTRFTFTDNAALRARLTDINTLYSTFTANDGVAAAAAGVGFDAVEGNNLPIMRGYYNIIDPVNQARLAVALDAFADISFGRFNIYSVMDQTVLNDITLQVTAFNTAYNPRNFYDTITYENIKSVMKTIETDMQDILDSRMRPTPAEIMNKNDGAEWKYTDDVLYYSYRDIANAADADDPLRHTKLTKYLGTIANKYDATKYDPRSVIVTQELVKKYSDSLSSSYAAKKLVIEELAKAIAGGNKADRVLERATELGEINKLLLRNRTTSAKTIKTAFDDLKKISSKKILPAHITKYASLRTADDTTYDEFIDISTFAVISNTVANTTDLSLPKISTPADLVKTYENEMKTLKTLSTSIDAKYRPIVDPVSMPEDVEIYVNKCTPLAEAAQGAGMDVIQETLINSCAEHVTNTGAVFNNYAYMREMSLYLDADKVNIARMAFPKLDMANANVVAFLNGFTIFLAGGNHARSSIEGGHKFATNGAAGDTAIGMFKYLTATAAAGGIAVPADFAARDIGAIANPNKFRKNGYAFGKEIYSAIPNITVDFKYFHLRRACADAYLQQDAGNYIISSHTLPALSAATDTVIHNAAVVAALGNNGRTLRAYSAPIRVALFGVDTRPITAATIVSGAGPMSQANCIEAIYKGLADALCIGKAKFQTVMKLLEDLTDGAYTREQKDADKNMDPLLIKTALGTTGSIEEKIEFNKKYAAPFDADIGPTRTAFTDAVALLNVAKEENADYHSKNLIHSAIDLSISTRELFINDSAHVKEQRTEIYNILAGADISIIRAAIATAIAAAAIDGTRANRQVVLTAVLTAVLDSLATVGDRRHLLATLQIQKQDAVNNNDAAVGNILHILSQMTEDITGSTLLNSVVFKNIIARIAGEFARSALFQSVTDIVAGGVVIGNITAANGYPAELVAMAAYIATPHNRAHLRGRVVNTTIQNGTNLRSTSPDLTSALTKTATNPIIDDHLLAIESTVRKNTAIAVYTIVATSMYFKATVSPTMAAESIYLDPYFLKAEYIYAMRMRVSKAKSIQAQVEINNIANHLKHMVRIQDRLAGNISNKLYTYNIAKSMKKFAEWIVKQSQNQSLVTPDMSNVKDIYNDIYLRMNRYLTQKTEYMDSLSSMSGTEKDQSMITEYYKTNLIGSIVGNIELSGETITSLGNSYGNESMEKPKIEELISEVGTEDWINKIEIMKEIKKKLQERTASLEKEKKTLAELEAELNEKLESFKTDYPAAAIPVLLGGDEAADRAEILRIRREIRRLRTRVAQIQRQVNITKQDLQLQEEALARIDELEFANTVTAAKTFSVDVEDIQTIERLTSLIQSQTSNRDFEAPEAYRRYTDGLVSGYTNYVLNTSEAILLDSHPSLQHPSKTRLLGKKISFNSVVFDLHNDHLGPKNIYQCFDFVLMTIYDMFWNRFGRGYSKIFRPFIAAVASAVPFNLADTPGIDTVHSFAAEMPFSNQIYNYYKFINDQSEKEEFLIDDITILPEAYRDNLQTYLPLLMFLCQHIQISASVQQRFLQKERVYGKTNPNNLLNALVIDNVFFANQPSELVKNKETILGAADSELLTNEAMDTIRLGKTSEMITTRKSAGPITIWDVRDYISKYGSEGFAAILSALSNWYHDPAPTIPESVSISRSSKLDTDNINVEGSTLGYGKYEPLTNYAKKCAYNCLWIRKLLTKEGTEYARDAIKRGDADTASGSALIPVFAALKCDRPEEAFKKLMGYKRIADDIRTCYNVSMKREPYSSCTLDYKAFITNIPTLDTGLIPDTNSKGIHSRLRDELNFEISTNINVPLLNKIKKTSNTGECALLAMYGCCYCGRKSYEEFRNHVSKCCNRELISESEYDNLIKNKPTSEQSRFVSSLKCLSGYNSGKNKFICSDAPCQDFGSEDYCIYEYSCDIDSIISSAMHGMKPTSFNMSVLLDQLETTRDKVEMFYDKVGSRFPRFDINNQISPGEANVISRLKKVSMDKVDELISHVNFKPYSHSTKLGKYISQEMNRSYSYPAAMYGGALTGGKERMDGIAIRTAYKKDDVTPIHAELAVNTKIKIAKKITSIVRTDTITNFDTDSNVFADVVRNLSSTNEPLRYLLEKSGYTGQVSDADIDKLMRRENISNIFSTAKSASTNQQLGIVLAGYAYRIYIAEDKKRAIADIIEEASGYIRRGFTARSIEKDLVGEYTTPVMMKRANNAITLARSLEIALREVYNEVAEVPKYGSFETYKNEATEIFATNKPKYVPFSLAADVIPGIVFAVTPTMNETANTVRLKDRITLGLACAGSEDLRSLFFGSKSYLYRPVSIFMQNNLNHTISLKDFPSLEALTKTNIVAGCDPAETVKLSANLIKYLFELQMKDNFSTQLSAFNNIQDPKFAVQSRLESTSDYTHYRYQAMATSVKLSKADYILMAGNVYTKANFTSLSDILHNVNYIDAPNSYYSGPEWDSYAKYGSNADQFTRYMSLNSQLTIAANARPMNDFDLVVAENIQETGIFPINIHSMMQEIPMANMINNNYSSDILVDWLLPTTNNPAKVNKLNYYLKNPLGADMIPLIRETGPEYHINKDKWNGDLKHPNAIIAYTTAAIAQRNNNKYQGHATPTIADQRLYAVIDNILIGDAAAVANNNTDQQIVRMTPFAGYDTTRTIGTFAVDTGIGSIYTESALLTKLIGKLGRIGTQGAVTAAAAGNYYDLPAVAGPAAAGNDRIGFFNSKEGLEILHNYKFLDHFVTKLGIAPIANPRLDSRYTTIDKKVVDYVRAAPAQLANDSKYTLLYKFMQRGSINALLFGYKMDSDFTSQFNKIKPKFGTAGTKTVSELIDSEFTDTSSQFNKEMKEVLEHIATYLEYVNGVYNGPQRATLAAIENIKRQLEQMSPIETYQKLQDPAFLNKIMATLKFTGYVRDNIVTRADVQAILDSYTNTYYDYHTTNDPVADATMAALYTDVYHKFFGDNIPGGIGNIVGGPATIAIYKMLYATADEAYVNQFQDYGFNAIQNAAETNDFTNRGVLNIADQDLLLTLLVLKSISAGVYLIHLSNNQNNPDLIADKGAIIDAFKRSEKLPGAQPGAVAAREINTYYYHQARHSITANDYHGGVDPSCIQPLIAGNTYCELLTKQITKKFKSEATSRRDLKNKVTGVAAMYL